MANVSDIRPITTLLVANRGEIARRVMRTARDMGIATVAIYADGDAQAPFVAEADMAIALNGRTSAETYLDVDKVLDACRRSGADAVHPGYGFLSENAGFAKAIIDAGIAWLGPAPEVIASMGDKLSAKKLMQDAGVPTLPAIEITAELNLSEAASEIGYPVLVKASAGGGGRGMRVVESEAELQAAVESAAREAGSKLRELNNRPKMSAERKQERRAELSAIVRRPVDIELAALGEDATYERVAKEAVVAKSAAVKAHERYRRLVANDAELKSAADAVSKAREEVAAAEKKLQASNRDLQAAIRAEAQKKREAANKKKNQQNNRNKKGKKKGTNKK